MGHLGNFHTEKYSKLADASLIGIVDIDSERAQKIAKQYQTAAYTDYREILDKVDAVSIAVPTDKHYEIAKEALLKGVDVLIEKPITHELWQAQELNSLARKERRILQVGHLERFNPAFQKMADAVKNPLFIECHRLHSFVSRGTEVDVVLDLMIHDLDIILYLVRSKVDSISAVGASILSNLMDIANVRLQFKNGCVANITSSRVSVNPLRKLRIFESQGYTSIDFHSHDIHMCRKVMGDKRELPEIQVENLSLEKKDALEEEIKSFLNCVRQRTQPLVSGYEALKALNLAHDIVNVIKKTAQKYYPSLGETAPSFDAISLE